MKTTLAAIHRVGSYSVLTLVVLLSLGCDRTDQALQEQKTARQSGGKLVGAALSPLNTLQESIAAYGRLDSYEDTAYVQLQYKLDGKQQQDRAPLCIGWEKGGAIGFRVYSVQAGPTQGRWNLRIDDSDSNLSNQVLVRAMPQKVDFPWLLSDPLVSEQLAAGLAGFPPQMDLLLSDSPFAGLIETADRIEFDDRVSIENSACYQVVIQHGELEYRLFIDQASMLLRKMILPTTNLPRAMLTDTRVSDLSLSIEFENIRTNSKVSFERFASPATQGMLQVNHFVPEPPRMDAAGVGGQVPGFRLRDEGGYSVFDSSQKKKATVLLWLANHPASELAARELSIAAQRMQESAVGEEIQYVPIWTEPSPPSDMTFKSLQESWNLPAKFAIDSEALGRDLFGVSEAPTLIVLDDNNRVQFRITTANPNMGQLLPGWLTRVVAGENVADTIIEENDLQTTRYVAELRMATSIAARVGHQDSFYSSYPPVLFDLQMLPAIDHPEPILSYGVDATQAIWLLGEEGALQRFANGIAASPTSEFATPWNASPGAKLSISADQNYIALWAPHNSEVQIFDTSSGQNRVVTLESDEFPVDLQWTNLRSSNSPRLALATNTGMLMLLDPTNHEQLSGRCPARPLAVLPSTDAGQVGGLVVLQDSTVQPMQLSTESTEHDFPQLPKAATSSFPRKIDFEPASGPWNVCQTGGKETRTLARGWIAKDEPGLFVLDEQLNPLWHRRIGIQDATSAKPMLTSAVDPTTGQATWVYADQEQTIYLLRADGVTDHFRLDDRFVGLTLAVEGTRLVLNIVRQNKIDRFQIAWQ